MASVGDAIVEGVDHPADGAAAVQQGRRAAHDFDAVDVDRVQRHGVVVGQRRRIQGAHAVAQQANAVAILATDDRSAGARAEVRRRHARLLVQGFAEAAFLLQGQLIAFQHGGRRSQLRAAQGVGGDDLGLQFQRMGFGADQQGGGEGRQAPGRGEGHRTFLGKRQKEKAANGNEQLTVDNYRYNITSLFALKRATFPQGLYSMRCFHLFAPSAKVRGCISSFCKRPGMTATSNDPLHGVTLQHVLTTLVEHYEWSRSGRAHRCPLFQERPEHQVEPDVPAQNPVGAGEVEGLYVKLMRTKRPLD